MVEMAAIDISELNYKLSFLMNEMSELTDENNRLTAENELLAAEKQKCSFEVPVPSLYFITVKETRLLLEELNFQFENGHFQVRVDISDETNCFSYIQAIVPTDLSDAVKPILANLDIDLQRGKSWKRDQANVNVAESAIISTGLSSNPFLLFLANGKLTVRLTNVVVRVYQADITSEDADAVVVSTRLNFNLTCFDGVEEAVARKAGQSYVNERRQKLRLAEQNNQPQEEN